MGYLAIAVVCSVAVSVWLKVLRMRGLDLRQTILTGYPVAFLLTWLLLKPDLTGLATMTTGAWGIVAALSVLLPLVFVWLARAIESVGIVATDAAQRLSLILPILAAFLLFGETLTTARGIGIALGFAALIALVYRPRTSAVTLAPATPLADLPTDAKLSPAGTPSHLWLLGVWIGYGVIDILFKQVAKQGAAFSLTIWLVFAGAAVLLAGYLLLSKVRWQAQALMAGLLLGVLNMGNIYAYVRAHQTLAESPSIVFTGMNVGVIALATVVGLTVFKEPVGRLTWLGLVLAVVSVLMLFVV